MSLLCGIYRLRPDAALPKLGAHICVPTSSVARSGVTEFGDARLFLLKLDIGAFDAPGWSDDPQRITALAGDAILTDSGEPRGRADDMAVLAGTDFRLCKSCWSRHEATSISRATTVRRVGLRSESIALACARCTCIVMPMCWYFPAHCG